MGRREVLFVDNGGWLVMRPPERVAFPTWKMSASQLILGENP